jgi:hypothetical protein
MTKIIAREVPPEQCDFSFYFDDDGLTNSSGKNCACYIIPGDRRRNTGFNMDEYKGIEEQAESIIDGFSDVPSGYYATYKEVMQDNGVPYTSHICHLLKEWVKTADTNDTDSIAEYLTIITGEKWNARAFCGYCQGDYCEVVYCMAHYTEDHVTEIGKFWLGCGTEFSIDDTYGYYVTDDMRWTEDKRLVKCLADMYGCKAEELEVHLYKGEHKVADYELLAV